MTLSLKWDDHNRPEQGDMRVAYDDGHTGREPGQQSVVEWRFRADPSDAWGEPTKQVITEPRIAIYDPPGDGWVQVNLYSIRDGITSLYAHLGVVSVEGGEVLNPRRYVDEDGNPYVDEDGNYYYDA